VIRKLPVKELNQPIFPPGSGDQGDGIVCLLLELVKLSSEERMRALGLGRRKMQDERAVRGVAAHNLLRDPIGKHSSIEVNNGNMEGCEVAPQPGVNAPATVRVERDDAAAENCARRDR
jgi:hypothetical protein